MKTVIDINLDAGEGVTQNERKIEDELLPLVSSCSIACGGHTGNRQSMKEAIIKAQQHCVRIGAHPSYPDPANFGRVTMKLSSQALFDSVYQQIGELQQVAKSLNADILYIKPHGALYHDLAHLTTDLSVFVDAVDRIKSQIPIMLLAGSPGLTWLKQAGYPAISEAFLDRRYLDNGDLQSRNVETAVFREPLEAVKQAISIILHGNVLSVGDKIIPIVADSLCVHGDNPAAFAILRTVRSNFIQYGIEVASRR